MSSDIYKAQAKRLGQHLLRAHHLKLPYAALLEAIAATHGARNWNVLAATSPANLAEVAPAPLGLGDFLAHATDGLFVLCTSSRQSAASAVAALKQTTANFAELPCSVLGEMPVAQQASVIVRRDPLLVLFSADLWDLQARSALLKLVESGHKVVALLPDIVSPADTLDAWLGDGFSARNLRGAERL